MLNEYKNMETERVHKQSDNSEPAGRKLKHVSSNICQTPTFFVNFCRKFSLIHIYFHLILRSFVVNYGTRILG